MSDEIRVAEPTPAAPAYVPMLSVVDPTRVQLLSSRFSLVASDDYICNIMAACVVVIAGWVALYPAESQAMVQSDITRMLLTAMGVPQA